MIQKIKKIAKTHKQIIGIGVSTEEDEPIRRTIKAAESTVAQDLADVILVGNRVEIESFGISSHLPISHTHAPEKTLLALLNANEIAGIVRGSLGASKFLREVKKEFAVPNIFRIALLETTSGFTFFFAPIGIDEGRTLGEKSLLVRAGVSLLKFLHLEDEPIGILSGGRAGDIGRDPLVDKTLLEAHKLVMYIKRHKISENIENYEILIENAIADGCRVIIAPDGISGNLIYRTLVHLGNGKSHGAWYYNIPRPIVDTSRVGPIFEYESAIAFASALASKLKQG